MKCKTGGIYSKLRETSKAPPIIHQSCGALLVFLSLFLHMWQPCGTVAPLPRPPLSIVDDIQERERWIEIQRISCLRCALV